jgi:hypothetical protein
MWSWLEIYPQHRFTNSAGINEQMSVGVAQNAVNGRLGSMSEPGAQGRSFHNGATDQSPNAVRYGLNATEQWERALREDPEFIFVTGWNEWIAGRFAEFNRVKFPVMFVDQFDQEHSRDIEPMRGAMQTIIIINLSVISGDTKAHVHHKWSRPAQFRSMERSPTGGTWHLSFAIPRAILFIESFAAGIRK